MLLADKNYYGGQFERLLDGLGLRLLRPARKGKAERAGAGLFRVDRWERLGELCEEGPPVHLVGLVQWSTGQARTQQG